MTTEQLKELASALSILSSKSSVLKERDELHALMDENLAAGEVCLCPFVMPTNCEFNVFGSIAGSEVPRRGVDEAHQIYADEDRRTIVRLRCTSRLLVADDFM